MKGHFLRLFLELSLEGGFLGGGFLEGGFLDGGSATTPAGINFGRFLLFL